MPYFMTITDAGKLTGVYPPVSASQVPAGALEITEDLYHEFLANEQTHHYDAASGTLVEDAPRPAPTPKPRAATTYQLMAALTDAQRAAYPGPIKAWDQRMFSARDTPWPETNEKIGRIATALGTSPGAWFDAALGAPPAAPSS